MQASTNGVALHPSVERSKTLETMFPDHPNKRLKSCLPCKERHLRCGKERPECSNCRGAKHQRPCQYETKRSFRFRQSRIAENLARGNAATLDDAEPTPFSGTDCHIVASSAWTPVAHGILPKHSRSDAKTPYAGSNSHFSRVAQPHSPMSPLSQAGAACVTSLVTAAVEPWLPDIPRQRQNERGEEGIRTETIDSTVGSIRPQRHGELANHFPCSPSQMQETTWNDEIPRHGLHDSYLVSDKSECEVFAFYVDTVGSWLDIGSTNHYFQSTVPQLAMSNPLLYFACLSCASQIMAMQGDIDKSTEESFSGKLLDLLIPLLASDEATTSNDALLGTTVILRMSEQFMDVGDDWQRHLTGAASLFANRSWWPLDERDLATASFWTHLRESIRVCFLYERACDIPLDNLVFNPRNTLPTAAPAETWTNRMTFLLLHTINLCWGPGASSDSLGELGEKLEGEIEEWKATLPSSFRPWCSSSGKDGPFPRIQYFESWHVVAWQFYHVARVMLSAFCQNTRSARNLQQVRRRIEQRLVTPTRLLCGICIHSTKNPGTTFNGSHLIAWSGQFLYEREEQRYLTAYLEQFSERTRWPTRVSLEKLLQRWEEQRVSDIG